MANEVSELKDIVLHIFGLLKGLQLPAEDLLEVWRLKGILDGSNKVIEVSVECIGCCSNTLVLVPVEDSTLEVSSDVVEISVVDDSFCIKDLTYSGVDIFSIFSIEEG